MVFFGLRNIIVKSLERSWNNECACLVSKKRSFPNIFCRLSARPYIQLFLGSPKTRLGVFGASTLKKMTGVTPSMRFFGVGASRLRFDASSSRLDVATVTTVNRYIDRYIDSHHSDSGVLTGTTTAGRVNARGSPGGLSSGPTCGLLFRKLAFHRHMFLA